MKSSYNELMRCLLLLMFILGSSQSVKLLGKFVYLFSYLFVFTWATPPKWTPLEEMLKVKIFISQAGVSCVLRRKGFIKLFIVHCC